MNVIDIINNFMKRNTSWKVTSIFAELFPLVIEYPRFVKWVDEEGEKGSDNYCINIYYVYAIKKDLAYWVELEDNDGLNGRICNDFKSKSLRNKYFRYDNIDENIMKELEMINKKILENPKEELLLVLKNAI